MPGLMSYWHLQTANGQPVAVAICKGAFTLRNDVVRRRMRRDVRRRTSMSRFLRFAMYDVACSVNDTDTLHVVFD